MMRLARLPSCGDESSDLSFAESFTRKRKADRSCLVELGEGKETEKNVKQTRKTKSCHNACSSSTCELRFLID